MSWGTASILPGSSEHHNPQRLFDGSDPVWEHFDEFIIGGATTDWEYPLGSQSQGASESEIWEFEAEEGEILGQVQVGSW